MLFLLLVYNVWYSGLNLSVSFNSYVMFFIISGSVGVVFIKLLNIGAIASQTFVNCNVIRWTFLFCCFPLLFSLAVLSNASLLFIVFSFCILSLTTYVSLPVYCCTAFVKEEQECCRFLLKYLVDSRSTGTFWRSEKFKGKRMQWRAHIMAVSNSLCVAIFV